MTENESKIDIDELRTLLEYNPDTGKIYWKVSPNNWTHAGREAGSPVRKSSYHRTKYRMVGARGAVMAAHRVAWALYYGEWPENDIDHINGDGLDNRIDNLRDVTSHDNLKNSWKHRLGHLMGTCYYKGRWNGFIYVDSKQVYLGRYDTAEEAHAAYLEAEEKYKRTGKV